MIVGDPESAVVEYALADFDVVVPVDPLMFVRQADHMTDFMENRHLAKDRIRAEYSLRASLTP